MRSALFQHTYAADLPDRLYAHAEPSKVAAPRLLELNENLATELGLDIDWLRSPEATSSAISCRSLVTVVPSLWENCLIPAASCATFS
jgi:uncharacterized protein YdiU (UPF0061 family)